ncbi:hypothetical protein BFP97_05300 [Roseivirga sp. 4D4]|uniref:hypothetical protein n=1 Tax=Roseivirga sp. 4D4 TaxID=1889784 RepID=UPI0008533D9C|nr:hypothetical protein [Roseivirga sp. 4D4]OEK00960.1 hypothetical protein BFP97_05300 [Roseivirga sp. 4D4]
MDLRKQLLKEHSKENTALIVSYIEAHPGKVDDLMDIFLNESYRLIQRSAWVVGDLGRSRPDWIKPYTPQMIQNLKNPDVHVAAKRNTMRYLQEIELEEDVWGDLLDIAMKFLSKNDETVAVKVFSMTVAYNIIKNIPELKDELRIVIEDQLPYGTAGFKNRGQKIISALNKL